MEKITLNFYLFCTAIAIAALWSAIMLMNADLSCWKWFIIMMLFGMFLLYTSLSWMFRPWKKK